MTIPNDPGTYRLHVGDSFLLGSTLDLRAAHADHRDLLRKGDHPVPDLQVAWWAMGDDGLRFEVVEVLPRKPGEDDGGLRRRLRLHEQWLLDAEFGKAGCVNRSCESGYNGGTGETMRAKWADPSFRERQVRAMQGARCGVSAETREKMSKAKRGGRNARARACVLRWQEKEHHFETVTEAARWLGVKQQVLDLWIRGKVAWPGTGRRASRYPEWVGLRGEMVG